VWGGLDSAPTFSKLNFPKKARRENMNLNDAIEIVLALAREHADEEQAEACDLLEDYAVNHLGDDT
jgi:hypothetical protein